MEGDVHIQCYHDTEVDKKKANDRALIAFLGSIGMRKDQLPSEVRICAKVCTGDKLSSWVGGAGGYLEKERGRASWEEIACKGLTERDLERERSMLLRFGAAHKHFIVLTPNNIVDRMFVYWQQFYDPEEDDTTPVEILVAMHHTHQDLPVFCRRYSRISADSKSNVSQVF